MGFPAPDLGKVGEESLPIGKAREGLFPEIELFPEESSRATCIDEEAAPKLYWLTLTDTLQVNAIGCF